MQLFIREMIFDKKLAVWVDEALHECPAEVDLQTVVSYVQARYGHSLDTAWTLTEAGDEVAIGWTVSSSIAGESQSPADELELTVVPMIHDPDTGELTGMLLWLFEQRKAFEELARATGAELQITTLPSVAAGAKTADE